MSSIFISYSRKDRLFAERLSAALDARSRDVWIDWEEQTACYPAWTRRAVTAQRAANTQDACARSMP